jgi:hypothetical protein
MVNIVKNHLLIIIIIRIYINHSFKWKIYFIKILRHFHIDFLNIG